jgi:hypothetical protein
VQAYGTWVKNDIWDLNLQRLTPLQLTPVELPSYQHLCEKEETSKSFPLLSESEKGEQTSLSPIHHNNPDPSPLNAYSCAN